MNGAYGFESHPRLQSYFFRNARQNPFKLYYGVAERQAILALLHMTLA